MAWSMAALRAAAALAAALAGRAGDGPSATRLFLPSLAGTAATVARAATVGGVNRATRETLASIAAVLWAVPEDNLVHVARVGVPATKVFGDVRTPAGSAVTGATAARAVGPVAVAQAKAVPTAE